MILGGGWFGFYVKHYWLQWLPNFSPGFDYFRFHLPGLGGGPGTPRGGLGARFFKMFLKKIEDEFFNSVKNKMPGVIPRTIRDHGIGWYRPV